MLVSLPPPYKIASFLFLIGIVLITPEAWGQEIPGALVPGRQHEVMTPPPSPKSMPEPAAPLVSEQTAPEQAKSIIFILNSLTIEGAVALPPARFNDLWRPFVGQKISVAKLYAMANAITQRYADEGYALSFAIVPEQKIENGNITLRVIEGFVDKIVFTGDPVISLLDVGGKTHPQGAFLGSLADHIVASKPLRGADLERYLILINDIPGVVAQATFAASPTAVGGSILTINVSRKVVEIEALADNRLSQNMGYWNAGGAVTFNGLINGADALQVQRRCSILSCDVYQDTDMVWSTLVGTEGLKLSANVNRSKERPASGILSALDFQGQDTSFSFVADYPLVRGRQKNLNVGVSFGADDSQTNTFVGPLTQDALRTVAMTSSYDFADRFEAKNLARLKFTQGVPVLGATTFNDPLKSRVNGSSTFSNVELHLVRDQPLGLLRSELDSFSFYVEGQGQVALTNSLLSSAQCTYGGPTFGRAYDAGALSGDHCLMGLMEIRRDDKVFAIPLQSYLFSDSGIAWQKGTLTAGEPRSIGAASTGFGLRFAQGEIISGDFQLAVPLRQPLSENGKGGTRFFVSLRAHY